MLLRVRRTKTQDGATLVEFAVGIMGFLTLVMGTIAAALGISAYTALRGGAQDALDIATKAPGMKALLKQESGILDPNSEEELAQRIRNAATKFPAGSGIVGTDPNLGFAYLNPENPVEVVLPGYGNGNPLDALRKQPIEIRVNAEVRPLFSFMPAIKLTAKAIGYYETPKAPLYDIPLRCDGQPVIPGAEAPGCACEAGLEYDEAYGNCRGCPAGMVDLFPNDGILSCACDTAGKDERDGLLDSINCIWTRCPEHSVWDEDNRICVCKKSAVWCPDKIDVGGDLQINPRNPWLKRDINNVWFCECACEGRSEDANSNDGQTNEDGTGDVDEYAAGLKNGCECKSGTGWKGDGKSSLTCECDPSSCRDANGNKNIPKNDPCDGAAGHLCQEGLQGGKYLVWGAERSWDNSDPTCQECLCLAGNVEGGKTYSPADTGGVCDPCQSPYFTDEAKRGLMITGIGEKMTVGEYRDLCFAKPGGNLVSREYSCVCEDTENQG